MARRRLTILLAATMAVGVTALPATAGPLDDLTSTTEDTVTEVTDTVEETADSATGGGDGSGDGGSGDDSTVDAGTGDGTLDVQLDADVAPSDDDGSPQLEVDGGVTVADQEVDVGGITDPVEDVVDPDPADEDGSDGPGSDGPSSEGPDGSGPGGSRAAGDDVQPATTPDGTSSDAGTSPEMMVRRLPRGGGTTDDATVRNTYHFGQDQGLDVSAPEVADRRAGAVEDPSVARPGGGDTATLATDTTPVGGGSGGGPLKVFAALLVLGTLILWKRTLDASA